MLDRNETVKHPNRGHINTAEKARHNLRAGGPMFRHGHCLTPGKERFAKIRFLQGDRISGS
jgi:hypothetical protein